MFFFKCFGTEYRDAALTTKLEDLSHAEVQLFESSVKQSSKDMFMS